MDIMMKRALLLLLPVLLSVQSCRTGDSIFVDAESFADAGGWVVDQQGMAGRDISCSHVALGSVRVMRTCGMMGEVVGLAASVCHRHASLPRSVYTDYFQELVPLMREGAGQQGLPNDQDFCIHGCFDPAMQGNPK